MLEGLAEVLASRTFCPDCHRQMEVIATQDVPGEGKVPVDFQCHYCDGKWTTEKARAAEGEPVT